MKRMRAVHFSICFALIWVGLVGTGCQADRGRDLAAREPSWMAEVGAEHAPESRREFCVNDFGAVADGKTLNSKSIQSAIDACAADGGGVVIFQPGKYLTGSIFVKSGVALRIDEGTTLLGSQKLEDYPEINTRVAGIEMRWPAALINVLGQHTAAITGKGTVYAQGKVFWDAYWALRREYEAKGLRWVVDYDARRPRTVLVANSTNVTVRGITLKQAGFWTVHVLYSAQVTCDGLIIRNNVGGHGPSTDGIDIDSSSHVLVENCDIDCNDDNFCIKAGRDWDGLRVNRPAEFIVIRDCISRAGGGLITFGSETSGGFRHILAKNLTAHGTGVGIRFKSARTRGGTIEDIHIENVEMNGVGTAVEVSLDWNPSYSYSELPEGYKPDEVPAHWLTLLRPVEPPERGNPTVRDVFISGLRVKEGQTAFQVSGTSESVVKDFEVKDAVIEAENPGSIAYSKDWTFHGVQLVTSGNRKLSVRHCTDMQLGSVVVRE